MKYNLCLALALLAPAAVLATNYDEAKVGDYTLPNPLVCTDGSRVTNSESWTQKRRPEILELYRENIFGRSPAGDERHVQHLGNLHQRARRRGHTQAG